jgi:hypothetical protein
LNPQEQQQPIPNLLQLLTLPPPSPPPAGQQGPTPVTSAFSDQPTRIPNFAPSSQRLQHMVLPFSGEIMRADDPLWQFTNKQFRTNVPLRLQG